MNKNYTDAPRLAAMTAERPLFVMTKHTTVFLPEYLLPVRPSCCDLALRLTTIRAPCGDFLKKTPNTDLVEPEEGAREQISLGKWQEDSVKLTFICLWLLIRSI